MDQQSWLNFSALPLLVNLTIFAVAAICVWFAGTRLAEYADAIGVRTGLSHAFLGMVLLGVATSLPELATSVTGSLIGNARLVAGNLFGGVALQIAVLALVDLIAVRGALTYFTPQPVLLFQGVMLLLLLSLALAGVASAEPVTVFGVGLTTILLMAGYLLTVRFSSRGDYLPRWRPTDTVQGADSSKSKPSRVKEISNRRIYVYAVLVGVMILVAGWALARVGDVLAEQTGLGASFIGVALVAGSTSLPELSTALAAVRRGNHEMAVSNILGTNCLEVGLFFIADLCYRGGPILAATDRAALFAGALGMIVTCIFLLGLLERRDRTVAGMGVDSLLVLIVYVVGLGGLYYLR
jgi:cation:H+ antiporter